MLRGKLKVIVSRTSPTLVTPVLVVFIDPSSISLGGRDISCTRDEMQLTLNRLTYPWLHPKYFDMHLIDTSCGLFHVNFTHIMVKTTYGECKTAKRNTAEGVIIYDNILMAFVRFQPGQVITRVPDVFFPFQCRFDPKKMTPISSKTSKPKGNGEWSNLPLFFERYRIGTNGFLTDCP